MESIVVYVSGVSLGNPGPAGVGILVIDGEVATETSLAIGNADVNFATYYAVMTALENLKEVPGEETKLKHFDFKLDNEMVYLQLTNQKEIKEPGLVPFFIAVHNLLVSSFTNISFALVPQAENEKAINLAKAVLDTK